jgi:RHS repeat-associated protein
LFLLFCACLTGAVSASAQYTQSSSLTDRQTPAGFAPGVPNGNIDSIDLFSGRVSVNFPLFTFGGRGEMGYTAYATINRTYNVRSIQTWSSPGQYGGQWNSPVYSLTSEGLNEDLGRAEVKAGLKPGIILARKMRDHNPDPSPASPVTCNSLTKLIFRTSGGEITFRDEGTNGLEQQRGANNAFNRGKVWVARDGSAMTFVSDTDIFDVSCGYADYASMNGENVEFPSGYLYMKNGVRYRVVNGEIVWMRDRNGNLLTITPGGTTDTRIVTDPSGRTYTIQTYIWAGAIQSQTVQYKGTGGTPRTLWVAYTALGNALRTDAVNRGGVKSLGQLFPSILWQSPNASLSPTVLSEITLADGQKYRFKYDEFGELARIENPNGSIVEFDYTAGPSATGNGVWTGYPPQIYRRVSVRRYFEREGVLGGWTTYDAGVKAYDADGALLSYTKHYFAGSFEGEFNYTGFWPPFDDGKETKTENCDASGNALVRMDNTWVPDVNSTALLSETKATLVPTNEFSRTTYAYDQYANVTDTYGYDYGGALLGRAHADYVTDPSYTSRTGAHLRTLVREAWVSTDAAGTNKITLNDVEYDNYTADPANGNRHAPLVARDHIAGLCTTSDPAGNCSNADPASYITRGNVTGMTSYLLANDASVSGSITANWQFDVAGNIVKAIDARRKPDGSGYETTYDFQDCFGAPDDEARANSVPPELAPPSGAQSSYAFPTAVTNAAGHTARTQYDYYTGQVVNIEDANGTVSSTHYEDELDRPTKAERAVNVPAAHSQTTIDYDDINRTVTTTSDQISLNDNLLKTVTVFNGMGLAVEAREYETAAQYISTLNKYDALGRPTETSNPYRPTLSETPVWTKTGYDILGRILTVTTPDAARLQVLYDGLRTLITDQSGKQRIGKVNALGKVSDVWEVVPSSSTDPEAETVTFPVPADVPVPAVSKGLKTTYTYDLMGNLRKVAQGAAQRRYFAYDSFGRIIRARNPEQDADASLALPPNMLSALSDGTNDWSLKYEYDECGNLKTKTDSRGVSTTYTYDAVNRVTFTNYSDSTPDITYTYDAAGVTNSKGRLTSISNGVSVYSYTAYDELGRVKGSAQTTGYSTYTMPDYQYDLADNLISEQYPSGRVVKTEYDAAGRVAGVKNQTTGLYYAGAASNDTNNRIKYAAHGAPSAIKLGNELWEHTEYNSRLQPRQIGLGTSVTDASVLKLDYTYGMIVNGALDETKNNGDIQSQTITIPGATSPYVQTYTYDSLNRLLTAEETIGPASNWKQIYSYDRYGNRVLTTGTTYPQTLSTTNNPTISQATNRITSPGYSYDNAGNLLCDPAHQCAQSPFAAYYAYDAEGRMMSASGGFAYGGTSFLYDGDGRRVRKATSGGETIVYVYDASGKLVAEYSDNPTQGGTSYPTADHLGSTRVVTAQNQVIKARHDYLPFGEELYAGRSGFGGGSIKQKFTGYEHDDETALDFAQARYYSSVLGRFTSPDLLMRSASISSPQSFNRYSYVSNNPLSFNDPTGSQQETADPCKIHKCITEHGTDPAGKDVLVTYYHDDTEDGAIVIVNVKEAVDVKDKNPSGAPVGGFFSPPPGVSTVAEPVTAPAVATEAASGIATAAKNIGGVIGSALARLASAIGMILTMPVTCQAPTLPPHHKMSDEKQEPAEDAAENPDGADNEPDTSENDSEDSGKGSDSKQSSSSKPPGYGKGWSKLRGNQGFKDPDGNIWKKDQLHKDHWDISDRKGNKVREVDFNGRQIWPGGPKNKNK